MTLRVSGKQMDVGDALRTHTIERLERALSKYFDIGYSGHVVTEKERSQFRTECHIHLDSGIDLQTEASGADAYQSLEGAAERLEKRLRRYKRRLKDHHARARASAPPEMASSFVVAGSSEESDEDLATDDELEGVDDNPVVVAETTTAIRVMTVGMAVMALDLSTAPVLMFRNAAHGRLNVVYRRDDGNVGWIDPPAATNGTS